MWQQKRIITSFWNFADIPRLHFEEIKKEKYTTLPIADDLGNLQAASLLGIRVIYASEFFDPSAIDDPLKRIVLEEIIAGMIAAGNVSALFIGDEPNTADYPRIKRMMDFWKLRMPTALPYVNLFPIFASEAQLGIDFATINQSDIKYNFFANWFDTAGRRRQIIAYIEYVQRFIDETNPLILSWDLYPFVQEGRDDFILNLAIISWLAKENGLPFFNTIQAGADSSSWQVPSEYQMRWQVYQSIAYGCRGIIYYTYWGTPSTQSLYQNGSKTPLAQVVQGINQEIENISPYILQLPHVATYHTENTPVGGKELTSEILPVKIRSSAPVSIGLFGSNQNTEAIFIANSNYYQAASITITTEKYLWQIDRGSGGLIPMKFQPSKTVKLFLAPGDGQLFLITHFPYRSSEF